MKLLALLAIWGGCAALAINIHSLWVRLPCWIIIGFVLHSLGVSCTRARTVSLFRKPWLDRPIGFSAVCRFSSLAAAIAQRTCCITI